MYVYLFIEPRPFSLMLLKTLLKRRTWDHLKCGKDIMDMFVNRSYSSLLNLILLLKVYITNVKKK